MVSFPETITIQRYFAIDLHNEYVMFDGMNDHQEQVLRPRRVQMSRFRDWSLQNLKPGDAIAYKMMTPVPPAGIWSQSLDTQALNGLTRQQLIKSGLLRLGLGSLLIRIVKNGVPRRIAPSQEILALKPELRLPD